MGLRNTATSISARVAARLHEPPLAFRSDLRGAEASIAHVVERTADIGGVAVRLRTDNAHLAEWWDANWHPSRGVQADAVLHAFTAVPGQAPHALYAPALDEALLVNTDYYGQCKSWALGLAAAILERRGILSIHSASVEVAGRGIVVVGGTGSGKSTQAARLARHAQGRLLGDDWVFVEPAPSGSRPRMTQPEAMLYVRTDNAVDDPALARVMEDGLVENAVTVRGRCTSEPCRRGRCMFDAGKPYCLWGHPNARALVPRSALAGPAGVCDEAFLDALAVLRRDSSNPSDEESQREVVLAALREGRSEVRPGGGPREAWGTMASQPYYNPYLLHGAARQDELFQAALRNAQAVLLNTARLGIAETAQRILAAAGAVAAPP